MTRPIPIKEVLLHRKHSPRKFLLDNANLIYLDLVRFSSKHQLDLLLPRSRLSGRV